MDEWSQSWEVERDRGEWDYGYSNSWTLHEVTAAQIEELESRGLLNEANFNGTHVKTTVSGWCIGCAEDSCYYYGESTGWSEDDILKSTKLHKRSDNG